MKRLFLVTLLSLTILSPLAVTAQTTKIKLVHDGEFASLNLSTDPTTSFRLNVARNFNTGSGTSASLTFNAFVFAPDFSSLTVTQIVGTIPSADFTGANTQNLALNFNTSDLDPATSSSQTCNIDLFTFIET
jgi:hypothetical protein